MSWYIEIDCGKEYEQYKRGMNRNIGDARKSKLIRNMQSGEKIRGRDIMQMLFVRTITDDRKYKVEIRLDILEKMQRSGIKIPDTSNLFNVDIDLLNLSFSYVAVKNVMITLMQCMKNRDISNITWRYICTDNPLLTNNTLNYTMHFANIDYLHLKYNIIAIDCGHLLFTERSNYDKRAALEKHTSQLELQKNIMTRQLAEMQSKIDAANAKYLKIEEKLNELKDGSKILDINMELKHMQERHSNLIKQINYQTIKYEKECNGFYYWLRRQPDASSTRISDALMLMTWFYQSCDHDHVHLQNITSSCLSRCDRDYSAKLEDSYQKFLAGQITTMSTSTSEHKYIINFDAKNIIQINQQTSKKRLLIRKKDSLISSLNFAENEDLEFIKKIAIMDKDDCKEFEEQFSKKEGFTFGSRIHKLFGESKSNGLSMFDLAEKNNCDVKIEVKILLNSNLARSFLVQRSTCDNKFCMLGFHGTHKTNPFTVATSGLDPRYSSTTNKLYLGAGVYISESPAYCHSGNYVHKSGDTYSLLGVVFLPGNPYNEHSPSSDEASKRRLPPSGYHSVTCIPPEGGARMFALYERYVMYPLYIINYSLVPR